MSNELGTGDLSQKPLAALLVEALRARATGLLTLEQGGGAAKLYLREGEPAGAQVFVGFKPLGQYLLSNGLIDIHTLDRSLVEMARTRRPQGEVLLSMGAITREALQNLLSVQQGEYLKLLATLDRGSWTFTPDAPLPHWTRAIRISGPRAIVEVMAGSGAAAHVAETLARFERQAVALLPAYDEWARALAFAGDEAKAVRLLRSPLLPSAFVDSSGLAPERARAILASLVSLGLAGAIAAPAAEAAAGDRPGAAASARAAEATPPSAFGSLGELEWTEPIGPPPPERPAASADDDADFDLPIDEELMSEDPAVIVADALSAAYESWLQYRDSGDLRRRLKDVLGMVGK